MYLRYNLDENQDYIYYMPHSKRKKLNKCVYIYILPYMLPLE